MPPRPRTAFEIPIEQAVVSLGIAQSWEFAGYLETPLGPLIEIRTLMRQDGADPSQSVIDAAAGNKLVVHHNHLSQESLSVPDWNGLATLFDEAFAHSADGKTYWGRVVDHQTVVRLIRTSPLCEDQNILFSILLAANVNDPTGLAFFFRKEVFNRAMKLRGFVEYEYTWGTQNVTPLGRPVSSPAYPPAGIAGVQIDHFIDQAAAAMAPQL